MKLLLKLVGIALSICLSINLFAQTAGTLTFSFTPLAQSPTYTGTKNVLAVWIQNTTGTGTGTFVKTKMRYVGGGTSDHLPAWAVNSGGTANNALSASCNITDATTGATLSSFSAKTIIWDGKNVSGTANGTTVADGTYKVTIQETWNHGTTGTYSVSFTFTKGPVADHQTPASTSYFSNIKLDWVPATGGAPTVTTNAVNVKCNGGNTGSATATATGTPPYTYTWSTTPAQTTATATGLAVGTYSVTVKDANGTTTSTVSVTQPSALTVSANRVNVSCNGGSNGSATATTTGGTPAYTYLWSNGKTTSAVTGLAAGNYTATITDANGCTKTTSVTLTQPLTALTSTVTNTNANCGSSNGSANVSAGGGTGNYTYLWSNGKTTTSITGLSPNAYSVTVTDANGCTATGVANVVDIGAPTASVTPTNVTGCFGGTNGSATVTVTGGTGALTYSWNTTPPQTTVNATGLAAGTYTVTITDASSCVVKVTTSIGQPTAVTASTTPTDASSCSANDGSVASNVSGGTAPYSYVWSNGKTTAAITGLAAGNYTLTATDAKGCKVTSVAMVSCLAAGADAGVNSVGNPSGSMCSSTIAPIVTLKNFGTPTLTSCTINYYVDTPPALTYSWNGSLASGASVNVNLPTIPGISIGTHTFYSSTSNPNGSMDINNGNDQSQSTFNVTNTTSAIPLVEGFESTTGLPSGWTLSNPDNDAAWQVVTTVAHTGVNCIGFDNCDGNGQGVDMRGTKADRFITSVYDFTSATASARLSFDVAYAVLNYKNQMYTDTLAVFASTDCGATWSQLYLKGGSTLSGITTSLSCWTPSSSDWRTDNVNLGNLAGKSSVMFAFENRSDWGEWIYIDNINITAITGIASINPLAGFSIYPNPAATSFTIEGASNAERIHYAIYSIVGAEVKTGDIPTNGSSFNGKIQVNDIPGGMYFIKVSDGKNTWTKKLNVQ